MFNYLFLYKLIELNFILKSWTGTEPGTLGIYNRGGDIYTVPVLLPASFFRVLVHVCVHVLIRVRIHVPVHLYAHINVQVHVYVLG